MGRSNVRGMFLCFAALLAAGVSGLRDVKLVVEPPVVQRGRHVTLHCLYDLEGAPLYSVKWYRGQLEFYRYSPSETPVIKIFPFPGFSVDLSSSNATQVLLRKVGFRLSGNFSCEVTADASFSTKTVSAQLLVVALPQGPPRIAVERDRYSAGDELRANCTAGPSRPQPLLAFFINDEPLSSKRLASTFASLRTPSTELVPAVLDILQPTTLSLDTRLLPSDFVERRMTLRCTAELAGLYHQSAELQLGNRPEPIPQRVTAANVTSKSLSRRQDLTLFLLSSSVATVFLR